MGTYSNAVFANSPLHYWRCFENNGARALEDIGSSVSYLWCADSSLQGSSFGNTAVPGLGWSGPASDGGAMVASGPGFKNFIPAAGTPTDPPGVQLPVPGALEAWFWGADFAEGTSLGWLFPSQPAGQQLAGFIWNATQALCQFLGQPAIAANLLSMTTWHHLVQVLNPTGFDFWVDGVHVGNTAASLSTSTVARNFFVGKTDQPGFALNQTGFIAEVAIYPTALSAGDVSNHFLAADNRTNQPVFYGIRPATVSSPLGYVLGTAHLGLTGTGSFSPAGGVVAALISVTTDTPEHGQIIGNPDYLLSRGYVNTSNSLGTVYEFDRLVFGTQVRRFPEFTSLVSWSLPPNLVVSITELSVR